jgi:hypothetical protein
MQAPFQFARAAPARRPFSGLLAGCVLAAISLWPAPARSADAPPGAIGQVEGRDVTVEGGTATSTNVSATPGIFVSNGSVVTVHSGQAEMTLFAGGEVDICGPAKITLLKTGDAITLALNFGRMRVQLPPTTALRIFTPTIIGTPLFISGGQRDVTVGLQLDDSLCVLAGTGAIQLEHQFSGEKLIVPQSGEFFLNAGQLVPVAGQPGSCHCQFVKEQSPPPPPPPIPEYAQAAPAPPVKPEVAPLTAVPPTVEQNVSPPLAPEYAEAAPVAPIRPEAAPLAAVPPTMDQNLAAPPLAETNAGPNVPPPIEYSVPARVTESHPVAPPARENAATPAPAAPAPVYTAVLPALTFSANAPEPPEDPTPDMTLLIREAQVEPESEFSGHVAPPEFVGAMQHALGVQGAKPGESSSAKKKHGFWSALKHLFGG